MKKSPTNYKSLLIGAVAIAAVVGSCADEALFKNNADFNHSDLIRFDVSSGFGDDESLTRSGEDGDDEGLPPVILSEGCDTLYLHRYVAPESERATGHNPVSETRSTPVNTLADFKTLNGESGFWVEAQYLADDNTDKGAYFPFSKAKWLSSEDGYDVYYPSEPHRYWPGKQELRFYALAPSSSYVPGDEVNSLLKNLESKDGVTSFSYTVPVTPASETEKDDAFYQPDLMFATKSWSHNQMIENTPMDNDYAPLNFQHALSAIKFAVRDVSKWNIVSISIKGVKGSGKCEFSEENGFVWSDLDNESEYTQTFNFQTTDPYDPSFTDAGHGVPSVDDAPVINDKNPKTTFMLIPQTIPTTGATLEIKLESIPEVEGEAKTVKVLSGNLYSTDIPKWEAGKEYIYTISTTAINWTYVFEVVGSKQKPLEYDGDTGMYTFGEFEDSKENLETGAHAVVSLNAIATDDAYFRIKSYKYRTNSPSKKVEVPWTANLTPGINDIPDKFEAYKDQEGIETTVSAQNWIKKVDTEGKPGDLVNESGNFGGEGSTELVTYNLKFKPEYVVTDYKGDWDLRKNELVGTRENPVDLSNSLQNTANCYVVNAGGWYSIPLYYGNAITGGKDNIKSYKNDVANNKLEPDPDNLYNYPTYYFLTDFKNYKGESIKFGNILDDINGRNNPDINAVLVWQDAYNIIDEVFYSNDQIVFHIQNLDLQQSNSVIALRDGEEIVWSWHIWVSDHWFSGAPNVGFGAGDVKCEAYDGNNFGDSGWYSFAPYNLGYCDPKNVGYLQRTGSFTFKQGETEITKEVPVTQDKLIIEYWIGNNTYYQFGRKDPMVGFINDDSKVKYNFGEYKYVLESGFVSINESIKNPNVFYYSDQSNTEIADYKDWLKTNYYNLWNNNTSKDIFLYDSNELQTINTVVNGQYIASNHPKLQDAYANSAVKTIYDPSPVGYVVPPADAFKLFTNGVANPNSSGVFSYTSFEKNFNGAYYPIPDRTGFNRYEAFSEKDNSAFDRIIFNCTGQRWWSSYNGDPGNCFGPNKVYLWSNTSDFYGDRSAYCLVIGLDGEGNTLQVVDAYFPAAKRMARPVRCVKEF